MPFIAKKTFEQAKDKHTLLIQLKDNQQNLLDDVKCLVKTQQPYDKHRQDIEMEHGRITRRTTRIYQNSLGDFILDDEWNERIKTVVEVERSTDVYHTKTKKYVRRKETAYYLCNGRIQTAQSAGGWEVQHWGIENKNHYVRDVTLLEDASRIRKNPLLLFCAQKASS